MNRKKIAILIGVLVVLAGALGYSYSSGKLAKKNIKKEETPAEVVVPRNLTAEETKTYQDRLGQADKVLAGLPQDQNTWNQEQKTAAYNAYTYKGMQLYGLGKISEANNTYQKAVQIKPDQNNGYVLLSTTQIEMKDYDKAKQSLQKATELAPKLPEAWVRLIDLERLNLKYSNQQIDDTFKQALEKTGENIDILINYAQFLESAGDKNKAIEYWKKAITAAPQNKALYQQEINRLQKQ